MPRGTLVGKSGRFGPFVGCSRYPDCTYIKKEGPPPPEPLPFEVVCPKNGDGHLVPRRARRTGNVFWGCSEYPKCDYTTNFEPVGACTTPTTARWRGRASRHLPDVRRDTTRRRTTSCRACGPGRPAEPGGARPAGPERWTRRWRREGAGDVHAAAESGARSTTGRTRPASGAGRVSGVGRRPTPPLRGSCVASPPGTLHPTPAAPTRPRSGRTSTGSTRGADWRRPSRADLRAYLAHLGAGRAAPRPPSDLPRSARSIAGPPASDWRPATRGARSRRRACRAACRASSRSTRSRRSSRSSTRSSRPPAGRGAGRDRDGLALRDRALVETAYAAGLRISELAAADLGSLDLKRGEIRVLGKGRKERIGLLGRPAREALATTSRTAGRSSSSARRTAADDAADARSS